MSSSHVSSDFAPLLRSNSIRLLQLVLVPPLPSITPTIPELGFLLSQFDLDTCPSYSALSYTWGEACWEGSENNEEEEPPSPSELVTILYLGCPDATEPSSQSSLRGYEENQRRPFPVTKNLHDGLQQLAHLGLEQWFWIDAICIDQDNNDEKAAQVALMGDIYSSAFKVIIWLGSDTRDWPEFAWLCNEFLMAMSAYCSTFGLEDLKAQTPYNTKILDHSKLQAPTGDLITCFERFFHFCRRRRWFSRMWIVQETVLAQKLIIQCGADTVSWMNVENLAGLVQALGWQSLIAPNINNDAFGRAIGDEIVRLGIIKQEFEARRDVPNTADLMDFVGGDCYDYLQTLLYQTRPYLATDPRDKVFGLLGITRAASRDMPTLVQPDYSTTATVELLYTSVATMLLKNVPRLANLSFLEDPGTRRIKNLPSWVPDYTVNLTPSPLTWTRNEEHSFSCSPRSSSSQATVDIDGNTLKLQAMLIDTVITVGAPMWHVLKTSDIHSCLEICKDIAQPYLDTDQDPSEVLARTLIADTNQGLPAPQNMLESFKAWACARIASFYTPDIISDDDDGAQTTNIHLGEPHIRSQLSFLQDLHEKWPSNSFPTLAEVLSKIRLMHHFKLQNFVAQNTFSDPHDPFASTSEQLNRVEAGTGPYHEALSIAVPFRRLFLTERGFLGIGPQSTEVGDRVWCVKDAKVPFVLRSAGDDEGSMKIIGECYLHGSMDGSMAARCGSFETVSIV